MLNTKALVLGALSVGIAGLFSNAHASTNLLQNPGFSGTLQNGGNWTALVSSGAYAPQTNSTLADWGGAVPNTTQSYWSVGFQAATTSNGAGLTATDVNNNPVTGNVGDSNNTGDYEFQDVGALQANTTYTLTVGVGSKTTGAVASALLYNGTISSVLPLTTASSGVLASGSYLTPSPVVNYLTVSYTTGATVSGDLTVVLGEDLQASPTTSPTTFLQSSFYNPILTATTTATPEPAELGLFAIGGMGLLMLRRRRQLA